MNKQRTDIHGLREQAEDPTEEQILAEIEMTRTEMSGTIDEIGNRLSPQVIADQAREQIREATVGRVERVVQDAGDTAQQTGSTIIGTIRDNPVPTTLAALGIGWLALRMRDQQGHAERRGNGRRRRRPEGWYTYDTGTDQGGYGVRGRYAPTVTAGQEQGEAGLRDQARERGQQIGEQARRATDDMSAQARRATDDMSQQAQATWQDVQSRAQDQAYTFQRTLNQTMDENPLALGALAVGVGAAVALAIPETQREREMMGEQRDQLLSEVESGANRALSEAEQSARETGQKIREESKSR